MPHHTSTPQQPLPARGAELPAEPGVQESCGQAASTAERSPAHQVSVRERGAFATARCDCGWRGPARRSRDTARSDAGAHSAGSDAADGQS